MSEEFRKEIGLAAVNAAKVMHLPLLWNTKSSAYFLLKTLSEGHGKRFQSLFIARRSF
jgi:hypothetical protein